MKKVKSTIALLMCILSLCSVISVAAFAANVPSKPSKITSSSVKQTSLKLKWSSVSGANFYRVFMKSDGKWKALKDTTSTSYSVTGLKSATTYTFAVKSGKKVSGRVYLSDSYATLKVKTKSISETKLTGTANIRSVTLKWAKINGVKGYSVYRKVSGEWKLITNLSSSKTSYTVKNLKSDTTYKFVVRGYSTVSGKKTYGASSNVLKIKTEPSNKVTLTCSKVSSKAAILNWTKATSVSGYRIYRYVNGDWVTQTTINSGSTLKATIKGLTPDKKHQFRIRAFKRNGSGVKWYDASDICTVVTDPAEGEFKVYRTEKLRKTFSSDKFTFSYTAYNDNYIKIPVTIAKSSKNYYLSARVDEFPCTLLNISSGNFILINDRKAYVKVPNVMASAVDVKSAISDLLPNEDYTAEATLEIFEGKKTVCETYTSIFDLQTLKYYYKAGVLIGIEELDSDGKTVDKIVVSSLKTSAKDSLFAVPSGYRRIAYSAR